MSQTSFNSNGLKAVGIVRRFLKEMGLSAAEQEFPDRTAFFVAFEGPADQGIAQITAQSERFAFHFVFPGYVPQERRLHVAEFITRANWRLIEGNFQMDFDTGVLRYKVGIDFSNTELTEPLVRNAILSGMDSIEMFASSLDAVIKGRLEPADAYQAASLKQLE